MKVPKTAPAFAVYNKMTPELIVIDDDDPKEKKRKKRRERNKKKLKINLPGNGTNDGAVVKKKKKKQQNKNKREKMASEIKEMLTSQNDVNKALTASSAETSVPSSANGSHNVTEEQTPEKNIGIEIMRKPAPHKVAPYIKAKGIDSFKDGVAAFSWVIYPMDVEKFFETAWEKKPLYIERNYTDYFSSLLTTEKFDEMLRTNNIQYTKNLDITSYTNGMRETHNPIGRAHPSVVWDYYMNGCSVRLLNPQTFCEPIWELNSHLQEYFGCFVGANVYLTPPGSQGFAPHYDDIEAFILQVEGEKHWKLYSPRKGSETLPRVSSANLTQEEIGSPILDVTLKAGDMMYFPRGTIHQASTSKDQHSLHITVSCYQKNSWADLMEKLVPAALKVACEEDIEFREGLPLNYLQYMGIAHSDRVTPESKVFMSKLKQLMTKLIAFAPVSAAVDQMGKQFMYDAMPPVLTWKDQRRSVFGSGYQLKDGKVLHRLALQPSTLVKIIRRHVIRLVLEEDAVRVYFSVENSREYHGGEQQFLEIQPNQAYLVEFLIHKYPQFCRVEKLPLEDLEEKMQLIGDLWEKGLIITKQPLKESTPDKSS